MLSIFIYEIIDISLKFFRIKFQWSKDKQNRIRPSAGGRTRRKSHKPNNKLRPERSQQRYNNQENDSVSNDNAVATPSYSDVPVQVRSEQKRISRHDEAIFAESQAMQQQRRPSHRPHEQRRCSRKSEVSLICMVHTMCITFRSSKYLLMDIKSFLVILFCQFIECIEKTFNRNDGFH